jgi:uncharacterized protein (UPF0147 family)
MRSSAHETARTIRSAVSKAQTILARYIHPGKRDCDEAINELAEVLDDENLVKAMKKPDEPVKPICERSRTGAF